MKLIRLELESFRILKKRERWQVYFIVYTKHPDNAEQTLVKFIPGGNDIRLKPLAGNFHSFKPTGVGTDGLRILEIDMPETNSIDVGIVMMQSRKKLRTIAAKLNDLKKDLDVSALKLIKLTNIQWYAIDKGFDLIAGILKNIKDRNMGYASMGEEFNLEFEQDPNQKRSNTLSTGEVEIHWVWEVKEK